ncbi:related to Dilute domain-containing protein YPR089W [Saccharomycodes ludwigii]|uniref:Related to Dilute domain-containing protein YPR089W n=1 Tax=Saccharomycodes ludwigii TaxID=36035 RepID=A0A376B8S5_9ASCO|nr:related to Dilute domain-containing protein YPR089W [Saccharomycodes ludwigii]
MWCFVLQNKDCLLELLNNVDDIDFQLKRDSLTAFDLLIPNTSFYNFVEDHNLLPLLTPTGTALNGAHTSIDIHNNASFNNEHDPVLDSIALQTAGLRIKSEDLFKPSSPNKHTLDRASSININDDFTDTMLFNYDKLEPDQYIMFGDYDISAILEYLLKLPVKHQHKPIIPASIVFQCIRYADKSLNSETLVNNFIDLCITKILSTSTNTKSGVVSSTTKDDNVNSGDVVLQSYWLGCFNILYYHLLKQDNFFKKYPQVLQNLVIGSRSLMIELCYSIHSRVVPLIQTTIFDYTTLNQVKETLYKKDWNFFKKSGSNSTNGTNETAAPNTDCPVKKKQNKDSYDEILKMLYPPTLEEQMKPSPMKIVQVYSALIYVLNLNSVHELISQQCLSLVMKWFNAVTFNSIMKNKSRKFLCRAKAMQIRLNLSVIQDWVMVNNLTPFKPTVSIDEFMWDRFPYTLIQNLADIDLDNQMELNKKLKFVIHASSKAKVLNETNSLFFYQSFIKIASIHLQPLLQILEWLQVATTLKDEESLNATLKLLDYLKPQQILKIMDRYRYEIDEPNFAFKKQLRAKLKKKNRLSFTFSRSTLSHSINSDDYLKEDETPIGIALPTLIELLPLYGGTSDYSPLLPIEIQDELDLLLENNKNIREQKQNDYNNNSSGSDYESYCTDNQEENHGNFENNVTGNPIDNVSERFFDNQEVEKTGHDTHDNFSISFKDDKGKADIFKELNVPSVAATKRQSWIQPTPEIEENPW